MKTQNCVKWKIKNFSDHTSVTNECITIDRVVKSEEGGREGQPNFDLHIITITRQNCTTPPNHWDFGIWLGWMSISWDPSQLHAIPNPDHPPLRICLTYQLFCTKKKCPWAFRPSYNIEIWFKVSNFSFSSFFLRFSSGQFRTLIQGRGIRKEIHYKNRLKTAASHHFKRHWIHWGELM